MFKTKHFITPFNVIILPLQAVLLTGSKELQNMIKAYLKNMTQKYS